MNKPTILSNEEWAFPTAIWDNTGGGTVLQELLNEKFSNIVISRDEGKTFYRRGGADVPERICDEHMLIELEDEKLWMLVRTKYGIGQSFSADLRKTWTPGGPSDIKGPDSRFFIQRLKSGKLLLVNHNKDQAGEYNRSFLTAWLSDDNGKSWYGELLLDERIGVSYPDGQQADDGSIYIIYDHDRIESGDIIMAHFTENDIINGKLISPNSYLKKLINTTGGIKQISKEKQTT